MLAAAAQNEAQRRRETIRRMAAAVIEESAAASRLRVPVQSVVRGGDPVGPGLAPMYRPPQEPGLGPQEDALILGPIRDGIAAARRRGNEPGARALDAVLPLVEQGALAVARMRRDGLDFDVSRPAELGGEVQA